jgi:outer membrane protein TolC
VSVPGLNLPSPRRDTYDAHFNAEQLLLDPGYGPRRAVERAELAEVDAQVRTMLYPLRQEVSDAFFTALGAQEREGQIAAAIRDLESRLAESAIQFQQGAATSADTASFAATLLARRQDLSAARADRSAALARLGELIGRPLADSVALAVPNLAVPAGDALRAVDQLRARPEYEQYAATRSRLSVQEDVESAQDKPRVSAFGRIGYGRPGLNLLSTSFQSYWLAGFEVQWTPWSWGTIGRDRQLLEIQRELAATDEQAFTRTLRRNVQQAVAAMARLDTTLALDERIVGLRERVDQTARARLREGAITAADYADRYSELVSARLARAQHVVELAQARASFLTTVGIQP